MLDTFDALFINLVVIEGLQSGRAFETRIG